MDVRHMDRSRIQGGSMSTYEVTYLAHTERSPERIEAASHAVDDSTSPPTHRFEVRGRIMSTRLIERVDVAAVRRIEPGSGDARGVPAAAASALPPFARQVSNRAFPKGRRPDSDR
jgi:hypothetical protein